MTRYVDRVFIIEDKFIVFWNCNQKKKIQFSSDFMAFYQPNKHVQVLLYLTGVDQTRPFLLISSWGHLDFDIWLFGVVCRIFLEHAENKNLLDIYIYVSLGNRNSSIYINNQILSYDRHTPTYAPINKKWTTFLMP